MPDPGQDGLPLVPEVADVGLAVPVEALALPRFERPWYAGVREARLLTAAPWARPLGKLPLVVSTVGWRFPAPPAEVAAAPKLYEPDAGPRATLNRRYTS